MGMENRRRRFLLVVALLVLGAGPVLAEASGPSDALPSGRSRPPDLLFEALAASRDPQDGKALEAAIRKEFLYSGSPSVDLLMGRGVDAFNAKEFDRAFFYFDEVVTLAPGFAEGWHKRATVYYLRNDYTHALRDLEHVLRLEPRHFDAIMGLAVMLQELGDKRGALDLYRRALKIDPWIDGAEAGIKSLQVKVEGRGI